MERDDLHREVYRTQGRLTSCFGYDPMGRKAWQFASTLPADKLSGVLGSESPQLLVEHAYNPIHRRYQYDPAGELVRTLDKLRGEIKYEYEANGQLHSRDTGKLVDSEEFRYDAAANRLNFNTSRFDHVKDNRLKQWRDQEYTYDAWGNLIEKRSGLAKWQTFTYDCENRLVRAETMLNSQLHSTGTYQYDSLGRRVAKQSQAKGKTEHKRFLWQGLRMLREESPGQSSLYVYEPGSYAPLARVDQREGDSGNKVYYFHTDQIGTPLEMTDIDGQIVWQATYKAWGSLEALTVSEVEQNLRFQGQYFDEETGLHYNTFRYYDPEVGRFITQDPIGLLGSVNLYSYASSPNNWIDPLGWCSTKLGNNMGHRSGDGMANHHLVPEELIKSPQFKTMFGRLKKIGWDPDGASNGIFLPGSKDLAQTTGMPGHWSSHGQYTEAVKNKLVRLNNNLGSLTDMDLALGVKNIQSWASQGLENGIFKVDSITGRLL
ncbi:RHS repeat-associated core domain-containing protein [Pseudomonas viridiflava]|uniref:RHS repeat-associated core domain-containing protein n=2 Tax=Pseudomonas viridiflava TaxID=33069 RepID=A0ABU7N8V0_PSEVI|nr:RHS repeat-associated core domain-containing protein [Pseudomonas viridiflava]MEE4041382.1 RHS repeat-associated core domain-containing protein [Pseudomonas viridiflava]MEE4061622.1 RHS repeat-associated core domain-containing protein [Pseudomonas viridiflava]MEE4171027.1 RHS repeat-associated core domain-containing protein [Pseudomonas viridiflava]